MFFYYFISVPHLFTWMFLVFLVQVICQNSCNLMQTYMAASPIEESGTYFWVNMWLISVGMYMLSTTTPSLFWKLLSRKKSISSKGITLRYSLPKSVLLEMFFSFTTLSSKNISDLQLYFLLGDKPRISWWESSIGVLFVFCASWELEATH